MDWSSRNNKGYYLSIVSDIRLPLYSYSREHDIYTVSKMLGHKDLKTTQLYAKIVDEAKREAANKIQLDIVIT